jgi:phage terminase large subunit-like protein
MRKYFKWTKERIRGLKNKGYIKGHTNNAKGKDGLRSGMVILNEIHTYENFDNLNVFTTGLGKKPDSRTAYFTTNGDVVDGPLDQLVKAGKEYLENDDLQDDGVLYFICNLDEKTEVDDELMWRKANPSLRYKPELLVEIRKEYRKWKKDPVRFPAFMTKRMNLRQTKEEMPVVEWELISATNKPIPLEKIQGSACTVGVDFSKTNDWVGVNIHFKDGLMRYDINHAWVCLQSRELWRLKCPYREWAEKGDITLVDELEISPGLIADYIARISAQYYVECVCIDSYRYTIFADALAKAGFSRENKNIKLYRPSDIIRVVPLINRYFVNGYFAWGDTPHLRWATNNTKLIPAKKSKVAADGEADFGNFLYDKIEPRARKTDPFMALVASIIVEDMIPDVEDVDYDDYDVFVF